MKPFTTVSGTCALLMLDNIDTDQLAPGHTLMKIQTTGFGPDLFANWRYLPDGSPDPDFILNKAPFDRAAFLVTGENFGCGSSREAAVWAVRDFGIRAVIARSFGTIFMRNCYNNGVLPIALSATDMESLLAAVSAHGHEVIVDLEQKCIFRPDGISIDFDISDVDRDRLLAGLDQIGATLSREHLIADFQAKDRARRPWVYAC